MANKGLQFEHAVMYAATSRITGERTREQEKFFTEAAKKWNDIPDDIKNKATELVTDMAPRGVADKQKYYGSFKKMSGGGTEPKTDIMFKKGGKTYKCSMKWGDSFQLTSSGIDTSVATLTKVLKKVAADLGSNNMSVNELGTLQLIVEQIANKFENRTGTLTQAEADRMMKDVNKAGGLNEQLQEILGSRRAPSGAAAYDAFKYELTKECMTGALTFANETDKAADHLLTEHGLKPIDDKAIREVMKKAGVRFSKKGRGKDDKGVRQNAITIRYEV
jgi:HJR/Mrr/RecB family endonuclease